MLKYLQLILLTVVLCISCSKNTNEEQILGTWIYLAEDASYGYQSGKVIFYETGEEKKARVEIQGVSLETENLKIEDGEVSFSIQTKEEKALVKLCINGAAMEGTIQNSEGAIVITMEKEVPLVGTWNYIAKDAPFGFQKGKVIFYEEENALKAKIKLYGFTIPCKDLNIEEASMSFTTEVEHEQVLINLERKGNVFEGRVRFSDGGMAISMHKKGSKNTDSEDKGNENEPRSTEGVGRVNIVETNSIGAELDYRVHTFYYGWFGNPEHNGKYQAWNHPVIPHWIDSTWNNIPNHRGGDDIGANFYPELGCYSSIDPETVNTHMQQISSAGIGVIAISWWGKNRYTDQSVKLLLDTAHKYGVKLAFHLEPFYKTTSKFKEELQYIADTYNNHPALYKLNGKPMYYLYNSFNLKHTEWLSMLNPVSPSTIRNTALDGVFIGLWTTAFDGEFIEKSGFDGFYTYFASDGFSHGSTTTNWKTISEFARKNNLIYIPSVGPGYIDTRIRPWNEKNTKDRERGRYYEKMYESAVNSKPDFISITSFNEWHEGTQIEPTVPKKDGNYTYEDFGEGIPSHFYLEKTKELIGSYKTRF